MKIGVLIVAYNAEDTLARVLDRIPSDFAQQIDSILVCDDASNYKHTNFHQTVTLLWPIRCDIFVTFAKIQNASSQITK